MSTTSSANTRIAKNTIFLYFRMILVLLISIYSTRVILNTLGVQDYGIYNVVCGFVAMFSFLNSSLSNGIQRFYNYEVGVGGKDGVAKVYKASLIIQAVLALLVLIIIEPVGYWYINHKMVIPIDRLCAANWIFHFAVMSFIFVIMQVPYHAAIIAFEKMDYYALVSILDAILKLAIVLSLYYLCGDKLILYGLLILFINILDFLLYYIYAKKSFPQLNFSVKTSDSLLKSIASFSGWNTVEMFAWMTQGQGVNMVLNLFYGTIVNAARGVSNQIINAVQGFCSNLVLAFRPQLIQSYAQGNIERTEKMMFSMSKLSFLLFFMLSLPIILDIDYILKLWLGDNVPEYSADFTRIAILSMFPRNFVMPISQVVHATGKMARYQICSAAIIIMVLPISYLFLRGGYSPISVYWIDLVVCVLLFLGCLFIFKTIFPINLKAYIREVMLPCFIIFIITSCSTSIIIKLMPSSFARLCLLYAVVIIVALSLSFVFLLNTREKAMFKELFFKKIKNNK